MNTLEIRSIISNLTDFTSKLSLEEFIDLTEWMCYGLLETPFIAPNKLQQEFIEEFFSTEVFAKILDDIRNPTKMWNKSSMSERELYDKIRIGLLQQSFFHLKDKPKTKITKPKPILSPTEKHTIKEIFQEHEAMLQHRLEDTDYLLSVGGQEAVDECERHIKFIQYFSKTYKL